MTPENEIKEAVQTEIDKRPELSWIRKDYIAVGVLFLVLAILSVVSIVNLNKIQEGIENDAGLEAHRLRTESGALCLVEMVVNLRRPDPVPPSEFISNYQACVERRLTVSAKPPPGVNVNPDE